MNSKFNNCKLTKLIKLSSIKSFLHMFNTGNILLKFVYLIKNKHFKIKIHKNLLIMKSKLFSIRIYAKLMI